MCRIQELHESRPTRFQEHAFIKPLKKGKEKPDKTIKFQKEKINLEILIRINASKHRITVYYNIFSFLQCYKLKK